MVCVVGGCPGIGGSGTGVTLGGIFSIFAGAVTGVVIETSSIPAEIFATVGALQWTQQQSR